MSRRFSIWVAIGMFVAAAVAVVIDQRVVEPLVNADAPGTSTLRIPGKVVPYRETLAAKFGVKLIENRGADILALENNSGDLVPILPTESARIFYDDPRMLNREMLITARTRERSPGLEILEVRSLKDGKPHEIYYWCETCSIKMFHLQNCECCQGPVEIREHPEGESFEILNRKK